MLRFRAWMSAAAGRDPLMPVAMAALAGILIADWSPPAWWLPGGGALAIVCFATAWLCPRWPGMLSLGALGGFGFAHAVALWSAGQFPFSVNLRNGESLRLEAVGTVIEEPAQPGLDRGGSGNGRCTIRFSEMTIAGRTLRCDQRLPVRLQGVAVPLRYGDRVSASGLLRPFAPPSAPGAFDPKTFFFRSLGATGELAIGPGDRVEILASHQGHRFVEWAVRSRGWIESAITRGLDDRPDDAAVIKAMTLGSREDTPEHIEEAYRLSGAMHVFSVSGLHVAIFGTVIWWLLRMLRMPRRWAVLTLMPAVVFYAAISGLPPSAVRAAVMGSVVLFAWVVERRPRLLNSLALAFLLVLAWDTQQLFRPGFQLSFAVLAAIGLFAESLKAALYWPCRIDPFLPGRLVPRWRKISDRVAEYLSTSLGVSIAAWAGSALLIVYHFQMITPIGVVANVVMIPLSFLVLATAIASLLISLLGLGWLCEWAVNPLNGLQAHLLTAVASFFADAPGSFLHVPGNTLTDSLPPDSARLVVTEPTISGLSLLLSDRSPAGTDTHWLIDPGDPAGYSSSGQPLLRQAGVNQLQALVVTHGDFDHMGAVPPLIERFRPRLVVDGPFDQRSSSYPKMIESITRSGAGHLRAAAGDLLTIGDTTTTSLRVLYPPRDAEPASLADDRCLVLLLRHREWRILLTADSGFLTEKWIMDHEPRAIQADVWIKGWHGSDASGLTEFLDRVAPRAIIATHHDFPENERIPDAWRTEVAARGIELFDLSTIGAVILRLDHDRIDIASHTGKRAGLHWRK
jgi:competence protein ComEC